MSLLYKDIGQMFRCKPKTNEAPVYYYTKVLGAGKNKPENMKLEPIKGNTNLNDIYNKIKTLGGVSKKPEDDEGIQIIKVTGKATPKDIGDHITQSEKNLPKPAEKEPSVYYYENKILGGQIQVLNEKGEPN